MWVPRFLQNKKWNMQVNLFILHFHPRCMRAEAICISNLCCRSWNLFRPSVMDWRHLVLHSYFSVMPICIFFRFMFYPVVGRVCSMTVIFEAFSGSCSWADRGRLRVRSGSSFFSVFRLWARGFAIEEKRHKEQDQKFFLVQQSKLKERETTASFFLNKLCSL